MADHQVGNILVSTHVDKRRSTSAGNAAASHGASHAGRVESIAAMKTRLTAISASSYTAERLATMTVNDMLYAIRLADEAAGL